MERKGTMDRISSHSSSVHSHVPNGSVSWKWQAWNKKGKRWRRRAGQAWIIEDFGKDGWGYAIATISSQLFIISLNPHALKAMMQHAHFLFYPSPSPSAFSCLSLSSPLSICLTSSRLYTCSTDSLYPDNETRTQKLRVCRVTVPLACSCTLRVPSCCYCCTSLILSLSPSFLLYRIRVQSVVAVGTPLRVDVYFDGTQLLYRKNASEEYGMKNGQRTGNILRWIMQRRLQECILFNHWCDVLGLPNPYLFLWHCHLLSVILCCFARTKAKPWRPCVRMEWTSKY